MYLSALRASQRTFLIYKSHFSGVYTRSLPPAVRWEHSFLKLSRKSYLSSSAVGHESKVLYRWPTMKHFRFISRLKVYQVSAMLLLLPPLTYMHLNGDITTVTMGYASVALLGTTAVLFILSYYFRRVIGEMAYIASSNHLRISILTFIGGRRDLYFKIEDIVAFADSQRRVGGAIQRLEVNNHPEVFLYSLKYGRVLDAELLHKCLQI